MRKAFIIAGLVCLLLDPGPGPELEPEDDRPCLEQCMADDDGPPGACFAICSDVE